MSWRNAPGEGNSERDRIRHLQISTDQWAVIRESIEHPKAIIQQVTARDQTARYLLHTWNPDPAQRRLHGMLDSLEEANHEVKWPSAPVRAAMATRESPGFNGRPSSSPI